jgi:predicted patatin/cPLA2 family phospholipase
MKALVISGGGSKGAFAGGVAEYLIKECGKQYDMFVGTSTGSLLAPFLAANKLEEAKRVFTKVQQEDIFTVCPFVFEKVNGEYNTSFNHLGIAKLLLNKEKTLGDSHNLRLYIENNFSESTFLEIQKSKKLVIVTVANLTKQTVEYKSITDCSYIDFCDWVWASANVLPFMSLVIKNGNEYGDGGFGNFIPIREAIDRGATSVDVIVLQASKREINMAPTRNAFQLMMRTYDFMFRQIGKDDIVIGQLAAENKDVDLHFYYTPRTLAENSFIFDPERLAAWWEEGFSTFKKQEPVSLKLK